METPQQVIINFMTALNNHGYSRISSDDETKNHTVSKQMLDDAIRACSNYSGIEEAIKAFIEDVNDAKNNENLTNTADKIKVACGIILNNDDTGAITGKDAGGSTTSKTAESVVPEDSPQNDFSIENLTRDDEGYLTFTVKGLTVRIMGERVKGSKTFTQITADDFSTLESNDDKKYQAVIIAGLYKWWIQSSIQLNEDSYSIGFSTDGVAVNQIDVYFETGSNNNTLAYVSTGSVDGAGRTRHLDLVINENYYKDITDYNDYNGEGTIKNDGAGYLDRTLAHEFTHAIMSANIDWFSDLPMFIKEGMAELTHGVDDNRLNEITALMENPAELSDFVNLTLTTSSQIKDSKKANYPYAAGYMFLRWLAKTASNDSSFPLSQLSANVELDENSSGNFYISSANSENQNATSDEPADNSLSVGTVSDKTYTANSAVKQNITYDGDWNIENISTGFNVNPSESSSENDKVTISGSGYNINVQTGGGADSVKVAGKNNILNLGSGNNTVDGNESNNAESKVQTSYGNDYIKYFGDNTTINAGAGDDSIIAYSEVNLMHVKNIYIDAGAGNDSIVHGGINSTILGGEGDDYISSYFSDAYGNSIDAGAGNDTVLVHEKDTTITGGEGEDTFIITSSADSITITDFNVADDFLDIYYRKEEVTESYVGYDSDKKALTFGNTLNIYLDNLNASIDEFYEMNIRIWQNDEKNYNVKQLYQWLGVEGVKPFSWSTGTYYIEIPDLTKDVTIKSGNATTSTPEDEKVYAKFEYDSSKRTLSISSIGTFDSNGDLTSSADFTGNFNIDAVEYLSNGQKSYASLVFQKKSDANYGLNFYNVYASSTFKDLKSNDSVQTLDINQEYQMLLNNKIYTSPGGITSFKIVHDESLNTYNSVAESGTFLVSDSINILDGTSYVVLTYTKGETNSDGVQVSINNGNVESVTDFEDGESFKLGDATYTRVGDLITCDVDNKVYTGDLETVSLDESYWRGIKNFDWTAGTYYFEIEDPAQDFSIEYGKQAYSTPGANTVNAKLTFDSSNNLTVEIVNDTESNAFTGNINISAYQ